MKHAEWARRFGTLLAFLALVGVMISTPKGADAAVGSRHWARATIFVQDDTVNPGVGMDAYIQDRVTYYQNMNVAWHVIKGKCQIGYPCVVTKLGDYGTTMGFGQTTFARECTTYVWCNFTGASGTWTTSRFNTSGAPGSVITSDELRALGCHELGHALADMQHASGDTCMNAAVGTTTSITLSDAEEGQIANRYYSTPYIIRK